MAVHHYGNANAENQNQQTAGAAAQDTTSHGPARYSLMNAQDISLWNIARNQPSEIVSAMEKGFKDFFEKIDSSMKFDLLTIDKNNFPEVMYSVVVLMAIADGIKEKPVVYHSYLIEASGLPIPSEVRNINGQQVEIQHLASDVNDGDLQKMIAALVAQRYPGRELLETSAEVVPRCFDVNAEAGVWLLFTNGILACRQKLDYHFNTRDLTLSDVSNDASLTVSVSRNHQHYSDMSGLPVRSDVLIETTVNAKSDPNAKFQMNRNRRSMWSRITGYVDFIWSKQNNQAHNQWATPQQPQQFQPIYTPLFVITSSMTETLQSLPAQLLTLASAAVLTENGNWTFAVMPNKGSGKKREIDKHDISAIGFDANFQNNPDGVGERIKDTDTDSFNLGKLNQLLSLVSSRNILIGLDVPECGSSTWQSAVFSAAAEGNTSANEDIIKAANYLTNGQFAKHWQGGQICYNYGGRVQLGYYIDGADKHRVDIRDIDYLAVLNWFGDRDMNRVRAWSESFNNDAIPLEIRLQDRARIQEALAPVYTGYARRNVFNMHFIEALTKGLKSGGLNIRPDIPYNDFTSDVRTAAGFVQQALVMTPINSGLFTNASTGGYTNYYANAATGWVNQGQGGNYNL